MLRRIALSLCLLASLAGIVPLVTSTAHNLRAQSARRWHHRRHSRAWWRRHRAMMRRRQAILARRRALELARRNGEVMPTTRAVAENHVVFATSAPTTGLSLPSGWSTAASSNGASTFRITPAGGTEGVATLSVVSPTNSAQPFGREQRNMVGSASFSDLRRSVIDKMISSGGWVVNDRQRDIAGRKVFEVIAQTPASQGNPDQVWNFYFAEINGRVYSLTTRTAGSNEKVVADAEKFIGALSPNEAAEAKRK
jgi:hypothetical protein